MSVQGIDQLLGELKAMSAQAASQSPIAQSATAAGANTPDFADMLKQSLDQVNSMQSTAQTQQTAFQAGDPNADLQDVMVSLQKASLSFQTMVQVRNKLVSAYQEIMNLQV